MTQPRFKHASTPRLRHTPVMGKHGMGTLYLRGKTWWAQYFVNGRRVQESTATDSKEAAQRFLKRRLGEAVTGKLTPGTERIRCGEIFADLVAHYQEHELASLRQLASRLKHLAALDRVRCADLGTRHLNAYRAQRKREGASLATIDREMEVIRRAFTLAAKHDPPKVNRVPHIEMYRPQNARQGFVDDATFQRLRDCLPPHLRLMAIVAYYTGLRAGAIRRIRRAWADLAAREIRIPPTKGKPTPDVVPLYGELHGAVEMALALVARDFPECPWLVQIDGRPPNADITHQSAWQSAAKAAGAEGLLFHDLRRSAARNMSNAGIPREVIKRIAGWKTDSVFERYRIVSAKDLHKAAAAMETFFDQQERLQKGVVN